MLRTWSRRPSIVSTRLASAGTRRSKSSTTAGGYAARARPPTEAAASARMEARHGTTPHLSGRLGHRERRMLLAPPVLVDSHPLRAPVGVDRLSANRPGVEARRAGSRTHGGPCSRSARPPPTVDRRPAERPRKPPLDRTSGDPARASAARGRRGRRSSRTAAIADRSPVRVPGSLQPTRSHPGPRG